MRLGKEFYSINRFQIFWEHGIVKIRVNVSTILCATAIFIGIFLRLYLISDQILLNDEWHGMVYAAMNDSVAFLLAHFNRSASCVPLNIYNHLLLNTIGYDETSLRVPSILGGLLSLVVLPFFIRKIFNSRCTVFFTCLLAISPFLIFYSRVARPYSLYMFLGFLSLWSLFVWSIKGDKKYAFIYVICGILAMYFHILAVIPVTVPFACVLLVKIWQVRKKIKIVKSPIIPSIRDITFVGAIMISISTILIAPGFLTSIFPAPFDSDEIVLKSLLGYLRMLCGSSNTLCLFSLYCLFIFGLITILKRYPLLGYSFILIGISYFGSFYILKPSCIQASIVISRYTIPLFPFYFIIVAVGFDSLFDKIERNRFWSKFGYSLSLQYVAGAGLLILLFTSGPLLNVYSQPNNFTNHSAFEEKYEPIDWRQSYTPEVSGWNASIKMEDVPEFYKKIESEQAYTIIEYPMSFVDQMNLYYYYQHFHKKKILAGYVVASDYNVILATHMSWLDNYLSIINLFQGKENYKFRNMVDMKDIKALKESSAKYIILHKKLIPDEWIMHCNNCAYNMGEIAKTVSTLSLHYPQFFGNPVFQDDKLIVFENK